MMNTRAKGSRGQYYVKCPLAQWTHPSGVDKNPSMTAKAGDPAVFKCWSCQNQGSAMKLARLYRDHSGNAAPYEFAASIDRPKSGWTKLSTYEGHGTYTKNLVNWKGKKRKVVSEDDLKIWLKLVPNIAIEKGMTKEQINRWEIGYSQYKKRMMIPVRDFTGTLVGASGRDVTGEQKPKYLHERGFKKEKYLFGEKFVDRDMKRVHIVEGFFDVFNLEKLGVINTLGSMGTSLGDEQIMKIRKWFKEVVFFPDADDDGQGLQFAEEFGKLLLIKGLKCGIAGVKKNTLFEKRDGSKPGKWEKEDFYFDVIDSLKGKDPGDYSESDLNSAMNNLLWIELKEVV